MGESTLAYDLITDLLDPDHELLSAEPLIARLCRRIVHGNLHPGLGAGSCGAMFSKGYAEPGRLFFAKHAGIYYVCLPRETAGFRSDILDDQAPLCRGKGDQLGHVRDRHPA